MSWPALVPPPPGPADGEHDVAIVVSIEDYAFLEDVPGAHANARAWVQWLTRTRGVPHVRTLRDDQATREAILETLEDAQARRGPEGTLWVVFIGHGAPGGQLLGVDAQATPASVRHRSLPARALQVDGGVAVVDACFAAPAGLDGLQPAVPSWAVARLPPEPARPRRSPRPAPAPRPEGTLLAAAGPAQWAGPLPGADRPAFSYLVLGALRGWGDLDGDGEVTSTEAVAWADRVLFEEATDRRQTPEHLGPVRSLARAVEPAPERAEPAPPPVAEPPRATPPAPAPRARARRRLRAVGADPAEASPGLLAAVAACALTLVGLGARGLGS